MSNSSPVPGTFAYTATQSGGSASVVAESTVLPVGIYSLTAAFTPADKTDFTSVTASVSLTVTVLVPTLAGFSPAYAGMGGSAFTLTATGTNFIPASIVYWGSTALTTSYVSAIQLKAQVPAALIASAGTSDITVQTPPPNGGASNAMQFEVDSSGFRGPGVVPGLRTDRSCGCRYGLWRPLGQRRRWFQPGHSHGEKLRRSDVDH
jgi:hypothetical protein